MEQDKIDKIVNLVKRIEITEENKEEVDQIKELIKNKNYARAVQILKQINKEGKVKLLDEINNNRILEENKENLEYEINNAINNSYSIENLSCDDIGKVLVKIAANYFE